MDIKRKSHGQSMVEMALFIYTFILLLVVLLEHFLEGIVWLGYWY